MRDRTSPAARSAACLTLALALVLPGVPLASSAVAAGTTTTTTTSAKTTTTSTTGGAAVASDAPSTPATVTADVLPTVQIDGVAWAQVIVGNTVYVTGKFTSARPAGSAPGQNEVPRANALAYDLRTGELLPWDPQLNADGQGITASPDGTRIYLVGNFTRVGSVNRYRLAAVDAVTGAVQTSFKAGFDYRARAVLAIGDTVYVGGAFSSANSAARSRLAAFRASDGALLPWAPAASAEVFSLVSPDGAKIVAGGKFATMNGQTAPGMTALDGTDGQLQPWPVNQVIKNSGSGSAIYSLSTDGTQVYGSGYNYQATGNFEGTFAADAATGNLTWVTGCRGDVYSVASVGPVVYSVGHQHNCSGIGGWPQEQPWTFQRATATTTDARRTNTAQWFKGRPAPDLLDWWPELQVGSATGQSQAAWSVAGSGDYITLAGEFPSVNNVPQQGLVRMARRPVAPATTGPRYQADFAPTLSVDDAGSVLVDFRSVWDYETRALTYRIVRNGVLSSPVGQVVQNSTWWSRPDVRFVDTTVAPGTTYSYRIYAYDADGNRTNSTAAAITTPPRTGNAAPAAAFTATPTGRDVSFDAAGSTDADGQIVGWAWDFGDGTTGTGAVAARTYATAGTYQVRLTVTDDKGATGSTTRTVTVTGTSASLARDAFSRTVSGGWGLAEAGGTWTTSGTGFSVDGSLGRMTTAKSRTNTAVLTSAPSSSTDLRVVTGVDKLPVAGAVTLRAQVRKISATAEYYGRLKVTGDGAVELGVGRVAAGGDTVLQGVVLPSPMAAGARWNLRVQAVDTNPTSLRAKAWPVGTAEPADWQLSVQDSSAGLQQSGGQGLSTYVAGTITNSPITAGYDDLTAQVP
ncbi:PKD domain-containing protein [Kineococcus gynurae]|uniref:PKD domain-containing protein n=2 Tax=Kineococcus gynurae TaxID=452979 RepID=A0ABV5LXY8_9ACTN